MLSITNRISTVQWMSSLWVNQHTVWVDLQFWILVVWATDTIKLRSFSPDATRYKVHFTVERKWSVWYGDLQSRQITNNKRRHGVGISMTQNEWTHCPQPERYGASFECVILQHNLLFEHLLFNTPGEYHKASLMMSQHWPGNR